LPQGAAPEAEAPAEDAEGTPQAIAARA
jgi:hypothetical protein